MAEEIKFPARILALAEQVKGVPLAYHEDDERIVIVFVDGRKLTFYKDKVTGETEAKLPPQVGPSAGKTPPAVPAPPQAADKPKSKRKEK